MYTTDSEPHTLSVTRLLGDENEQLKKKFTVYISSGSRTDETSFLKIQTHNTIFMLYSTCLAIHADRNENIPISIAQSKLTPTTIKGEKRTSNFLIRRFEGTCWVWISHSSYHTYSIQVKIEIGSRVARLKEPERNARKNEKRKLTAQKAL